LHLVVHALDDRGLVEGDGGLLDEFGCSEEELLAGELESVTDLGVVGFEGAETV
jgi:hypothetical protein